jgi:hypothetical protein
LYHSLGDQNDEQITPNVRAHGPDSDTRCVCGSWDNSLDWRCSGTTTAAAAERNIVNLDHGNNHDCNPYDPWFDSLG